ncbi:hypothetical protein RI367_000700 [Sorochytrium milnesiophthora]
MGHGASTQVHADSTAADNATSSANYRPNAGSIGAKQGKGKGGATKTAAAGQQDPTSQLYSTIDDILQDIGSSPPSPLSQPAGSGVSSGGRGGDKLSRPPPPHLRTASNNNSNSNGKTDRFQQQSKPSSFYEDSSSGSLPEADSEGDPPQQHQRVSPQQLAQRLRNVAAQAAPERSLKDHRSPSEELMISLGGITQPDSDQAPAPPMQTRHAKKSFDKDRWKKANHHEMADGYQQQQQQQEPSGAALSPCETTPVTANTELLTDMDEMLMQDILGERSAQSRRGRLLQG